MKKILFYLLVGTSFIAQSCMNPNEDPVPVIPSEGASVNPFVNGSAQPNQVWIDLSDIDALSGQPKQTVTNRTDWDLAFYTGNEFKVVLNSSIAMGAGKGPNLNDLTQVNEINAKPFTDLIQVANFDAGNEIYIDDVNSKEILSFITKDNRHRKKFNFIADIILEGHRNSELYDKENINERCKDVTAMKFFKGQENARIYCMEITLSISLPFPNWKKRLMLLSI